MKNRGRIWALLDESRDSDGVGDSWGAQGGVGAVCFKWRTFLRMEVVSNNLKDFGLKKTLLYFEAVRQRLGEVVDRFADTQAGNLNA